MRIVGIVRFRLGSHGKKSRSVFMPRFMSAFAIACCATTAIVMVSCDRSDRAADRRTGDRFTSAASTCPPAPGGIIVSFDRVAYFPARAPESQLERLCPAVGDTLYDAVGWQANGRKFPFVGAMLVAIPHQGTSPDSIAGGAPEMWTASGDSVRLPDGQLLPKTLGALRALGKTLVDKNEGYDDWNGPDARTCRFPEILFKLNGDSLPKTLPDSARVTGIEINVRSRETMGPFCRP
jgi:hypothetical protein